MPIFRTSEKRTSRISLMLFLAVLSGVLLAVSAIPSKVWFLNFVALVPLLFAAQNASKAKRPLWAFMGFVAVTMSVFYLWVGFWILKTANLGFLLGILIILPYLFLLSPYELMLRKNEKIAAIYFIVAWLSVEFIQNFYELGSPFFNLGHSLGAAPKLIQWYEYTGAAGGTLWILLVNVLLYKLINAFILKTGKWKKQAIIALSVLVLPMLLSLAIYNAYEEKGNSIEVLIVHPSTDCYLEKYKMNIYELMNHYLDIILPQLTDRTSYVILPETALTNGGWVHQLNDNLIIDHFNSKTKQFPSLKLVTGAVTFEAVKNISKYSQYEKMPNFRYSKKHKIWYRTYNAAFFIEKNNSLQMRTKQELVPLQEYAPFPEFLPRILPVGINFKFSSRKENQDVFVSSNKEKISTLICYESVFGKLYSKYAREGAEVFFELLNEGWYNNFKVSKQFIGISSVRAIENRRDIAHSSNMGITCAVNQKGNIINSIEAKKEDALKVSLHFNKQKTFYTLVGDYISVISLVLMLLLFVYSIKSKKIG